jgi:hypothetical protein
VTNIAKAYVEHPAAWLGKDLTKDDISFDLNTRHLDAFERVLLDAKRQGITWRTASDEDFTLNDICDDIQLIADEVLDGRGVVILRGWPVERFSPDELGLLFWAVGKQIGRPVIQNWQGDRLIYVRDLGVATERGSTSNKELPLHTDFHSVVGLLAIQKAKEGGISRIVSVRECYKRIMESHPEYLAPLHAGYQIRYKGDPGEPDIVTDYPVPVLSEVGGQVNAFIVKPYMQSAAETPEQPLAGLPLEALNYFQQVAENPEMSFSFALEPGEASIMCNHSVLHSRTAFEDWPDIERRRLLLRLWLEVEDERRPIHPNLRLFFKSGGFYARQRETQVTKV